MYYNKSQHNNCHYKHRHAMCVRVIFWGCPPRERPLQNVWRGIANFRLEGFLFRFLLVVKDFFLRQAKPSARFSGQICSSFKTGYFPLICLQCRIFYYYRTYYTTFVTSSPKNGKYHSDVSNSNLIICCLTCRLKVCNDI